jgi:hypothetical protein
LNRSVIPCSYGLLPAGGFLDVIDGLGLEVSISAIPLRMTPASSSPDGLWRTNSRPLLICVISSPSP